MRNLRFVSLFTLVVASACATAQRSQEAAPVTSESAPSPKKATSDATQPLSEFESLAPTDIDLYLKVMRTAAERLRNLSSADREALNAFRKGISPSMSAEQMAALDRATMLMNLDETVAKEMGVYKRYQSISGRIPDMNWGSMGGEGDASDDPPTMTAEQKQERKVRIEKFRQRQKLDDANLAPHREEILLLQKQVHLMFHPESIPK